PHPERPRRPGPPDRRRPGPPGRLRPRADQEDPGDRHRGAGLRSRPVTVAVHQFVPTYRPRDAIGGHARQVRRALIQAGIESRLFVEAPVRAVGEVEDYRAFAGGDGPTWLLYQLSTGSPMARFLQARPEPKIVNYHNITPASF